MPVVQAGAIHRHLRMGSTASQVEAELKHLYVAKMEELVYARDLQVQQERLQGELGHEDAPTVAQAAELASHRAELRDMLQTTAERLEMEREVATAAQASMRHAEETLRAAEAQVRYASWGCRTWRLCSVALVKELSTRVKPVRLVSSVKLANRASRSQFDHSLVGGRAVAV